MDFRRDIESMIFYCSLRNSSSTHRLDLTSFIDSNVSNATTCFPSASDLPTPSSSSSISNVYQPSDIVALLEPSSPDESGTTQSTENAIINDITNTLSSPMPNVQSSCSSAAAAVAANSALLQENFLSSLFGSFEPFSKLFPGDEQSTATTPTTATRYNPLLPASPLLTTAPDHSHHPIYYGHNTSWH